MLRTVLDACFTDSSGVERCPSYLHDNPTPVYIAIGVAIVFILGLSAAFMRLRARRSAER